VRSPIFAHRTRKDGAPRCFLLIYAIDSHRRLGSICFSHRDFWPTHRRQLAFGTFQTTQVAINAIPSKTYRERLRNPRWKELEEHFGTAIPEAIKNLYQQTGLLIERDVIFREKNDREWHIAEFLPADLESLEETWPDVRKSRNLPFARDFFDDCYYVDLQAGNSSRCPVMICHHDGSDVELVAGSLAEFLGWHRAR
jgi:hypothetical protein